MTSTKNNTTPQKPEASNGKPYSVKYNKKLSFALAGPANISGLATAVYCFYYRKILFGADTFISEGANEFSFENKMNILAWAG